MPYASHHERHRTTSTGWLRASVLGANDGLLSTSSLLLGVVAAHGDRASLLIAGASSVAAGAMAMAAGEYVSVQSQADTEAADLARERLELQVDDEGEHNELASLYVGRGLEPHLAKEVALQLMAQDAIGAHARDELGITESLRARPLQAALASGASFAAGACLPMAVAATFAGSSLIVAIPGLSIVALATLGALAAKAGGASIAVGAARVSFWGALAMGVTAGVGALFGAAT